MTPHPAATPDIIAAVAAFNHDDWAGAFLLFQTYWLCVRTDEAKALAQYANAVNQLHLGLTQAPRTALARVYALTEGVRPTLGVDLAALRRDIVRLQAVMPAGDLPVDVAQLGALVVRLEWLS